MNATGSLPGSLTDAPFVRIIVAAVEGSAPREGGASMIVGAASCIGTIGGGQLEFEAIAHARVMLAKADHAPWMRELRTWPLGPSLGQCCGGTVRVLFEKFAGDEQDAYLRLYGGPDQAGVIVHPVAPGQPLSLLTQRRKARDLPLPLAKIAGDMLSGARIPQALFLPARGNLPAHFIEPVSKPLHPLFIYGAGHVGRAIVRIAADLDFDIHWVDTHADRFPAEIPGNVTKIAAAQPERIAIAAPPGAFHLVLTYSHAIDLAICRTLLKEPRFGFLGLIGSKTKKARFVKRLRESGIASPALTRLTCPIGIGSLRGKEPATIAVGAAAQLIEQREKLRQHVHADDVGDDGTDKQISA